MEFPKSAIVLLNYNSLNYLEQFLPGLTKNSPDWATIYCIDNNSNDGSEQWVKKNYSDVNWIQLDNNYGFAEGYNLGLQQVKEECVVLLNTDIEVTEEWLPPLIKRLQSTEKIVAVQPKILDFNRPDYFEYAGAAGGFIDYLGYPFCRGRIFNHIEQDSRQYNESIQCFWASGACMALKKTAFIKAGGFDKRFFMHMEEIDLCWRFQRMGFEIWFESTSKVYHVGGGSLNYNSPKKTYFNFRNNLIMLQKNLPPEKGIFIIMVRAFLDWIAAFRELLNFRWKHIFAIGNAWLSFLLGVFNWGKQYNTLKNQESKNIYKKSIVYDFFLKKRQEFTSLHHEDDNHWS